MRPSGNQDMFRRFHSVSQSNMQINEALNQHSRGLVQQEQKVVSSTALQDVHTGSYKYMDDMVAIFEKQIEHMSPEEKEYFEQEKAAAEHSTPTYTVNHRPVQRNLSLSRWIGEDIREISGLSSYIESYFGDHYAYQKELYRMLTGRHMKSLYYQRRMGNAPQPNNYEYKHIYELPHALYKKEMTEDYRDYLTGRISFDTYERRETIRRMEEQGGVSNKSASFVLDSEY